MHQPPLCAWRTVLIVCLACLWHVCVRSVLKGATLKLHREFPIKNATQVIRSCFCPLISQLDGACIVSGCESMNIKIYDEIRDDSPCINELMGHSGAVLDVSWNYDESLLASCDDTGAVILWKRVK
jgi:WD repeat-containing protein 13